MDFEADSPLNIRQLLEVKYFTTDALLIEEADKHWELLSLLQG